MLDWEKPVGEVIKERRATCAISGDEPAVIFTATYVLQHGIRGREIEALDLTPFFHPAQARVSG